MNSEQFEAVLIEVKDAATFAFNDLAYEQVVDEEKHDAMLEDARAVWHAAELALWRLRRGRYHPKKEAWDEVSAAIADENGEDA